MEDYTKRRQQHLKRWTALKSERSSWDPSWVEIADYTKPRRSRFFTAEANKGTKKGSKIINSTASLALDALAAGMHEGITSPARQWFGLTTEDPDLAKFGQAKSWLHQLQDRTYQYFARSNIYKSLPIVYTDLGAMGTCAMLLERDFDKVLRSHVFPVGSYALAINELGEVDTLYREVSMTTRQMVEKFGKEKCSLSVRTEYDKGTYDAHHQVLHAIEPNADYQAGKLGHAGKRWKSCWLEQTGDTKAGYLLESGYDRCPIIAPRWQLTADEDTYGVSPGMDAIGDIKALQLYERRKAQAVDKIVDPPMRGPAALRNQRISLAPGSVTYVDAMQPGQQFAPAYELNPAAINVVEMSIREHEQRINQVFKKDLFLMLSNTTDDAQKTAREVVELHEEKMLQLGPVFGQVNNELLEPLVNAFVQELIERQMVPPPPQELQGQELKIEYLSVVAIAQKIIKSGNTREFTTYVANLAGVFPEAGDLLNVDEVIHDMADSLGVKPELTRSDEDVQQIRDQRAKAQAQQAQMQQQMAAAEGAKTLSQADTSGDNALTRSLSTVPGAAAGSLGQ